MHTYIHTYTHTYTHSRTCILDMYAYMNARIHTYMQTCLHTFPCIHSYITASARSALTMNSVLAKLKHSYIHTHIHTYIQTYKHIQTHKHTLREFLLVLGYHVPVLGYHVPQKDATRAWQIKQKVPKYPKYSRNEKFE